MAENTSTGVIGGDYIALEAPASGSIVANFTASGVLFFSRVSVPGYLLMEKKLSGALVRLTGNLAAADFHDTPSSTATIDFHANATATIGLGAGVMAAAGPNASVDLAAAGSNLTGSLWGSCALSIVGGGTAVALAAPADCTLNFNAHMLNNTTGSQLTAAAVTGEVAAEVYLGDTPADPSDVATFGNTTVIVTHAGDRTLVSIETLSDGPKSVVVHFAAPAAGSSTHVLIDGQPAKAADSLDDALQPSDDGGQVEYLLSSEASSGLLVVSMPNSGSHVIEMQPVSAGPAPAAPAASPLLAGVLGLALVAVAAAALFRRR